MTVFDLFVLAIVGASVAAGALRGFVRALIASVGLVVGLVVAAHFYGTAGALLRSIGVVESAEASNAGGFLLVTGVVLLAGFILGDRKSTRLNSSHVRISYAVFCLKKK